MPSVKFEFDPQKAIEVILYITERRKRPTLLDILKLMYLADKTSLEKYGRFITGDNYVAMRHGPVASNTYDLLKDVMNPEQIGFAVEGYHIKTFREADTDELSDSDILCLDETMAAFGHLPTFALVDETHDEAWENIWNQTASENDPIPVEDIIELFEGHEELLDYLMTRNND